MNLYSQARKIADKHVQASLGASLSTMSDNPEIGSFVDMIEDMLQDGQTEEQILNSPDMPTSDDLMVWDF